MNYVCITYKELAEMLSVSHATVKANWKYYPHFFITESSKSSNNLKGARFNLEDVLNFCKKQSTVSTHITTPQMPQPQVKQQKQKKYIASRNTGNHIDTQITHKKSTYPQLH